MKLRSHLFVRERRITFTEYCSSASSLQLAFALLRNQGVVFGVSSSMAETTGTSVIFKVCGRCQSFLHHSCNTHVVFPAVKMINALSRLISPYTACIDIFYVHKKWLKCKRLYRDVFAAPSRDRTPRIRYSAYGKRYCRWQACTLTSSGVPTCRRANEESR